jgi:LysM repeat protein
VHGRSPRLRLLGWILALGLLAGPAWAGSASVGDAPAAAKKSTKAGAKASKKKRKKRRSRQWGHEDCAYRTPLHEHVVIQDEHLGLIAGRYGVRRADLVALNPQLENPDLIRPGDRIRVCPLIPPRERRRIAYEVQPGDNLHKIAEAHGLTVREVELMQRGKLRDPNTIHPGQKLVLWQDGEILPAFRPPPVRKPGGGRLKNAVRLPKSRHYRVKRPHLSYGTAKTIRLIQTVMSSYRRRHRTGPKINVGDISKRTGGRLPPHLSHRTGRDVDLGYVLQGKDANKVRFAGVRRGNIDLPRTWALVSSFLDTHEVVYIFMDYNVQKWLYDHAKEHGVSQEYLDEVFQYPRGRGRSHGIIRHWKSHRNHFHVRFKR